VVFVTKLKGEPCASPSALPKRRLTAVFGIGIAALLVGLTVASLVVRR
jgi:hypothetical protein